MVNVFDYFWKPDSLLSKFCVNCLLMFYFVCCNNCVLNDVNGACWCTCSLVALRVPEMCFSPAKTWKNLKFLRCIHVFDLVLKYCSDINEGNWLDLLFLLPCIDGFSCLGSWIVFFICASGFRLKFSRIALLRKRLQLDSKTDLITIGLIFFFCCYMPRFVDFISAWTKICKNCSNIILFWRHQIFSTVWRVFLSVL